MDSKTIETVEQMAREHWNEAHDFGLEFFRGEAECPDCFLYTDRPCETCKGSGKDPGVEAHPIAHHIESAADDACQALCQVADLVARCRVALDRQTEPVPVELAELLPALEAHGQEMARALALLEVIAERAAATETEG
jgi:hypothetical protein